MVRKGSKCRLSLAPSLHRGLPLALPKHPQHLCSSPVPKRVIIYFFIPSKPSSPVCPEGLHSTSERRLSLMKILSEDSPSSCLWWSLAGHPFGSLTGEKWKNEQGHAHRGHWISQHIESWKLNWKSQNYCFYLHYLIFKFKGSATQGTPTWWFW